MSNPKGIVSPWSKPEARREEGPPPEPWKTDADDPTGNQHDKVRFPGRTRALHVQPLHGKGEPEARARVVLGKALIELFQKVPETRSYFARQSVGFDLPTGPHVAIDLGGVPLYAGTVTAEPETARRMAVDRIAHALTESKARHPKAKEILEKHRVEVSIS